MERMIKKILSWAGAAIVGLIVLVAVAMGLIGWLAPAAPAKPEQAIALDPALVRKQQVQAAIDQGEAQLIAYLKSNMHDPGSFELVDDRYIDAGDHITAVMTYRGRNGFNALRLERIGATLDLQGNIKTVMPVE